MKPKYLTIKEKCLKQADTFRKWGDNQSWGSFHSSHYDWWAFPIA
jgi:hypothetical protein